VATHPERLGPPLPPSGSARPSPSCPPDGRMNVTWTSVIAVLVLAQKLLPPKAAIDVPLALAIAGLGIVVFIAPSSVPGPAAPM